MSLKKVAVKMFKDVLQSVDPKLFMPESLRWSEQTGELFIQDKKFQIPDSKEIFIIGFGKASPTMAQAVEKILGPRLKSGYIIAPPGSSANLKRTEMAIGSHPIPDERSIEATNGLISFVNRIPDDSLILNLISGGTSALLCSPANPLTLKDLQTVTKLLIESGANIQEMNTVRKTLSAVKGGRLLDHLKSHMLIDLIISDVPDDNKKHIGSGPTTPQSISYTDAIELVVKYNIYDNLPENVRDYLNHQANTVKDFHTEDLKGYQPDLHYSRIISSAIKVAHRAAELIKNEKFETKIVEPAWSGDIEKFVKQISHHIEEMLQSDGSDQKALIFFGECTVQIHGDGLGGRNQELALRMSRYLQRYEHEIVFLSAGTDGIDGPTDAAGAVVDQNSYKEALKLDLNPDEYLQNNDSYHFFQEAGGHIMTGPTGNNVMDLQIILSNKSA